MRALKKIYEELKSIARTALYFAIFFLIMMLMKKLLLEDYDIEYSGLSMALIGALVLAKVIILMELIPLGKNVERLPAMVDVTVRTILYTVGVGVVILLEKAFEARHQAGGFGNAFGYVFSHRDIYHILAATLVCTISIFFYNVYSILKKGLGDNFLRKIFFKIPLDKLQPEVH